MDKVFSLHGLTCPHCSAKIEQAAGKIPGVQNASVNLVRQILTLQVPDTPHNWLEEVTHIVQTYEPEVQVSEKTDTSHPTLFSELQEKELRRPLLRLGLGALIFAVSLAAASFFPHLPIALPLFIAAYLVLGLDVIKRAVQNLRRRNFLDENFLMTLSTLGAFAIQEYPEAVAVMLFYQTGEFFQELAVSRSRASITDLMELKAETALVKRSGQWVNVPPQEVAVGEIVRVAPGEVFPLDGTVISGTSFMDTSSLTGESLLRKIYPNESVFAGCVNQQGPITLQVTCPLQESAAAKMLDLVENAAAKKAPAEHFITAFARWYTPLVVGGALLLAILPPLITGQPFTDWLRRALVFLVISCPCALVLSVPLTFFGGIGAACKKGVLIKGGNYLDALHKVRYIAFDKTGTLTRGDFRVTQIFPQNGISEEQLLQTAAFAESFSQHPIARSILKAYAKPVDPESLQDYREIPGKGIITHMNGQRITVGSQTFLHEQGIPCPPLAVPGTKIHAAQNSQYLGSILISDECKPSALTLTHQLKQLGIRRCFMLSGDEPAAVVPIAKALGMDGCASRLLPQDKVTRLEQLKEQTSGRGLILFMGDGMNDAPVLACADIGASMGRLGSDAAAMAADIVLMSDDPASLLDAIRIAQKTRQIVWQNILLSLGVKALFLLAGALGQVGLWEAVFADVGVMLLAVLNSLRIFRN